MTLSILDSQVKKQQIGKIITIYLIITLFCGLFSLLYEHYSHGVYSNYMIFLFVFPLAGGVLPFCLLAILRRLPIPGRFSLNAHHAGVAALAVGSCMQGVLEIYGTTSGYIVVYWAVGIFLVMLAIVSYCAMIKHDYRQRTILKRSL